MLVEQFDELEFPGVIVDLPLISYRNFDRQALSEDAVNSVVKRGVIPWFPLFGNEESIQRAKLFQALGIPVILMDYRGGKWPMSDGCFAEQNLFSAWNDVGEQVREALTIYKNAGVKVASIWCDWEGFPFRAKVDDFQFESPGESEKLHFYRYRSQLWTNLLSSYLAAPVLSFYPNASVTNWSINVASRDMPIELWNNQISGLFQPTLFNTSNPVAYGNAVFFEKQWPNGDWPTDRSKVDQAYFHLMLRQISSDCWNRMRELPYMCSVPWVARCVKDSRNKQIPVMSREAYRESLRHIWLRGISGMMVFNPHIKSSLHASEHELEDAMLVYHEMVNYHDLIINGRVLNLAIPEIEYEGVVWSGMGTDDHLLIRASHFGVGSVQVWVGVSRNERYLLNVPVAGKWFYIKRGNSINH